MKPLLLVDIDQVVCDFVTPFCEWGNKVFGKDVSPADVDCYDMFRLFGMHPMSEKQVIEIFFFDHTSIPEITGAVQGIKDLSADYLIHYATARPMSTHILTVNWLDARGIAYRVVHTSSTDKVRALNTLFRQSPHITGMIEDNPTTALEAARRGWRVWLLDYTYNRNVEHELITRIKDWPELVGSARSANVKVVS